MPTMTDVERIERERTEQRIESHIDGLPPLNDHLPDETPPQFEWDPTPTEQERADFYARFGVKMSRFPLF